MAKANFEKEMEKHRAFFQERGIYAIIYTDKNLKDKTAFFESDFVPLLQPEKPKSYLSFSVMEEYFD